MYNKKTVPPNSEEAFVKKTRETVDKVTCEVMKELKIEEKDFIREGFDLHFERDFRRSLTDLFIKHHIGITLRK